MGGFFRKNGGKIRPVFRTSQRPRKLLFRQYGSSSCRVAGGRIGFDVGRPESPLSRPGIPQLSSGKTCRPVSSLDSLCL